MILLHKVEDPRVHSQQKQHRIYDSMQDLQIYDNKDHNEFQNLCSICKRSIAVKLIIVLICANR